MDGDTYSGKLVFSWGSYIQLLDFLMHFLPLNFQFGGRAPFTRFISRSFRSENIALWLFFILWTRGHRCSKMASFHFGFYDSFWGMMWTVETVSSFSSESESVLENYHFLSFYFPSFLRQIWGWTRCIFEFHFGVQSVSLRIAAKSALRVSRFTSRSGVMDPDRRNRCRFWGRFIVTGPMSWMLLNRIPLSRNRT